ncbi:MAG: lysophospholipase [Acidobacteriota bacterium]|nr:lysophospholipase [Acidobacteriota bacterium]
MRAGWGKMKADAGEAGRREMSTGDAAMEAQFKIMLAPEMRSMLFYDPAVVLRKVKVPVLALNGGRDFQVPPAQNLPVIRAALAAVGNQDFTVKELPGLNHLFQTCTLCTLAEYGTLEETFSPAALEIIGDWILRHAASNKGPGTAAQNRRSELTATN